MFITIIKTLLTTHVVIPKYSQDLKHIPEIPRVAERAPLGPPAGLVVNIICINTTYWCLFTTYTPKYNVNIQ